MYALISLNDANYQPLADITWYKNKVKYAEKHGYRAFLKTEGFRPADLGFQKLDLAKDVFKNHPDCEWVWWTGTDTLITNFACRIEDRIDNNYHFIVATDVNGINTDSFLVRNSPEGNEFINEVLSKEEEANRYWDKEQRAIARTLGLPATGEQWPISPFVTLNEKYSSIAKIVPQRYMNSYNYQLYHYQDHRDKLGVNGNWEPGDWLIHWPGTMFEHRMHLAQFYIQNIRY